MRRVTSTITLPISLSGGTSGGGGGGGTGGTTIPSGVTSQAIDGGPTYYATGYNNGSTIVPFSYAAASVTNNSVTYSQGWDDPAFFGLGPFGIRISIPGTVTMFNSLNWNFVYFLNSDTDLTVVNNAGISHILSNAELFDTLGVPNNGILGSLKNNLSAPLSHCISVAIDDEPGGSAIAITDPIAGIQTLQTGTHVSGTTVKITNAIQDGRLFWTNFQGFANMAFGNACGILMTDLMSNTYPTPNATVRRATDMIGLDAYHMTVARRATPLTTGNRGWGATAANCYYYQGAAFYESYLSMARASHQGDWVDFMRQWCSSTTPRPINVAIQLQNGRTGNPYEVSFVEFNWECWTAIIHGARSIIFFDHTDAAGTFDPSAEDPAEGGCMAGPNATVNQKCSFTGSISGNTLTVAAGAVTGFPTSGTGYFLQPGMQITTGAGSAPYPTIAAQLTFVQEASFNATYSNFADPNNVPVTVSSVSGTIPVPCIIENVTHPDTDQDPIFLNLSFGTGAPTYSPGVYNGKFFGAMQVARTNDAFICWHPGMAGTYLLSGYTGGTVSGVSMTAKQPDARALGAPTTGTNNNGTGTIFSQVAATCAMIKSLAPVINSPFAKGYLTSSTTPLGYIFPSNVVGNASIPAIQTSAALTYGTTSTGLDCCVKRYTGSTYTCITGDSIVPAFYIIATTRCTEDTINTSVTFHLADPLATSVTVIGEAPGGGPGTGRTITVTGQAFTDRGSYPREQSQIAGIYSRRVAGRGGRGQPLRIAGRSACSFSRGHQECDPRGRGFD